VRNVIFDLGGVVLEWNPEAILEKYYLDLDARATMRAALFQHPDWLLLDRGALTETEAILRLGKRTGRSRPELMRLFDAVRDSLRLKSDTVALIERLARQRVPLYCLSNMSASTFAYLRSRYAFWPLFRGVVISGEVKMMKPEPEIFVHLLRRYELTAGDTVFIDDLGPNVQSAQAVGLLTVLFRDAQQCENELECLLGAE
jgi:putative hydrolase of the HAD superfamily